MKWSRLSEEQIVGVQQEHQAGAKTEEDCGGVELVTKGC